MSQQLKAYIPESLLTDGKQEHTLRVCREDCLIVDPADRFRILVSRGTTSTVGKRLDAAYNVPVSEMRFLRETLTNRNRVLMMGHDGRALLVFGDLFRASGVLVVLSPYADAFAVARLLRHTGRSDFVFSPSLSSVSAAPHTEDEEIYEQILELFFYFDRILSPARQIGLRTRTHLIANFVGCVLDDVAVPLDSLDCSTAEQDRLVAFLLCAFLSLRAHDGVSARTETPSNEPILRYRVETMTPCEETGAPNQAFPFLSLPTFRRFAVLSSKDGAPTLEACLHLLGGKDAVRSAPLYHIGLRFVAS